VIICLATSALISDGLLSSLATLRLILAPEMKVTWKACRVKRERKTPRTAVV